MKNRKQIDIPSCRNCEKRKDHALFCNLSINELDKFSEDRADNFYKKGQVIFYEGNRGHGIYCIHKGKVKVHKDRDDGKEQIVRLARDGELLGYRSLLGDEPYNATATAIEDSVICYVRKSKFLDVVENNVQLTHKVMKLLTGDLKESERKLVSITQKPALERIGEALLILKEKFGLKEDAKTLDIAITRREIGDLAGVSTETTIRILAELNKTSALHLNGKSIELTDLRKLTELANILD